MAKEYKVDYVEINLPSPSLKFVADLLNKYAQDGWKPIFVGDMITTVTRGVYSLIYVIFERGGGNEDILAR